MAKNSSVKFHQEARATGSYGKEVRETLWHAYHPYLKRIAFICSCGWLGRFLLLSNANLIGLWVDSLCGEYSTQCPPRHGFSATWGSQEFLIALLSLVGAGFLCTIFFRISFSRLSAQAISQLYDETTLRTSRFPMSFFDRTPVGRIVTRFSSDYGNVFRLFGGPLAEFQSIIFDLSCLILLSGVASPYFLPLIFIFMGFHFLVYRRNREHMKANRRALSASRSPSIAHFAETAQGASTIRTFNKEMSFNGRFTHLDQHYLSQRWRTVKAVMLFSWQNNLLTGLMLLVTGLISWFLLQEGLVSVGAIGVSFGFITLSGSTVLMFFEWLAQVEEALIGVERLNGFLQHEIEPGSRLPADAQFKTGHPVESTTPDPFLAITQKPRVGVKLTGISFRYADDLPWVLKDFNLDIKAGQKVGIVGRTGSGKSTITQILLHLYPIAEGRVEIDGVEATLGPKETGLSLKNYRKAFSLISQDPVLFRGTLRDNLDLSRTIPEAKLLEVLRTVGLQEWSSPAFLEMPIEERGRNISYGEKQLICLARALLQDTPIVIMDEATSAVDPQSEEILVEAAERFFQGKTQIIIAHRLSTLESCDRIIWLQNGKIQLDGPPAKILLEFEKSNLSPV